MIGFYNDFSCGISIFKSDDTLLFSTGTFTVYHLRFGGLVFSLTAGQIIRYQFSLSRA